MSESEDPRTFARPFGVSDVLIYFVPGATALGAVTAFEFRAQSAPLGTDFKTPLLTSLLSTTAQVGSGGVYVAAYMAVLLGVIYITGHLVSSASSFFIDRMLVQKGHGYPYLYFLGMRHSSTHFRSLSEAYYRGLFFWVNGYLLWRYWQSVWNSQPFGWGDGLFGLALLILTAAKILAYPARKHVGQEKLEFLWKWCVRPAAALFSFGYNGIAHFAVNFLSSKSSFNEEFLGMYRRYFRANFDIEPEVAGSNNHWFPYMYVAVNEPRLNRMLVNWLYLYEFARNLATAFYAAFAYCATSVFLQMPHTSKSWDETVFWLPVALWCAAHLMLARYYYLYVSYYTKFLFRAFVFSAMRRHSPSAGN